MRAGQLAKYVPAARPASFLFSAATLTLLRRRCFVARRVCDIITELRANIKDIEHERAFLVGRVRCVAPIDRSRMLPACLHVRVA